MAACRLPAFSCGHVSAVTGQTRNETHPGEECVKRPYQPNTRKRAKRHGFRHRMSTRAGRAIVNARRRKGRARLSA